MPKKVWTMPMIRLWKVIFQLVVWPRYSVEKIQKLDSKSLPIFSKEKTTEAVAATMSTGVAAL
jgi:hypothetical protein